MYLILIFILVIGCNNPLAHEDSCSECGGEITSSLPEENGIYQLQLDTTRVQTYTMLTWETNCGWSKKIQWDTNYKYRIGGQDINLINPASMTDSDGIGRIIFGVWQDFKGYTVTCYGGYLDDCDNVHQDSIKVKIL